MSRTKTFRLKIDKVILDRLEEAARIDGETLNSWMVDSLRNQLRLWEIDRVRDAIALEEIEREVLFKGQEASPVDGASGIGHCEMCLKEFVPDPENVDGPKFCRKCMEISRGGDFSELTT